MHDRLHSPTRRTGFLRGIACILLGLISLTQAAYSATTLAWDASTSTNISGYRLYYGSSSGNYAQAIDVGKTTSATLSNLVNGGTYYVAVSAYDASSLESVLSNEVSFKVSDNKAPTVSLTAPTTGTAPATLSLSASASDSDGSISSVEFYNGTTRLATVTTSPYTFNWSGVAAGTYTLTARAIDNQGASTTSAAVTVTVKATSAQAPTVSLTSPGGTSYTPPATVTVVASAIANSGTITKVAFYRGTTLLGQKTASPYSLTMSSIPAGTYNITAKAYNSQGLSTMSAPLTITVAKAVNKLPTVSLTAPATGTSYTAPASITLNATASDSDGSISRVDFYRGTTKIGQSTVSPYSFTWSGVAAGTYTLTARAIDNLGASTTSTAVSVTVKAASAAPTVSLACPAGTSYTAPATITVVASAKASTGSITKVEFYNGTSLVGQSTVSPYTLTMSNIPAGTYIATAKAYDSQGKSTTSAPITLTVR